MYGDIGQKSNTMFFSDKPADVNALMAQAATIFKATPSLENQATASSSADTSTDTIRNISDDSDADSDTVLHTSVTDRVEGDGVMRSEGDRGSDRDKD